MFVSREEALAVHEVRHKLRCTRNGEAWLFVPYMPSACYAVGHYTDDGWAQCPGEGCAWHHRKQIAKCHVVALCVRKPIPFTKFSDYTAPTKVPFRAGDWEQKIMELTGGVIKPFTAKRYAPDTMCLVGRAPGRKTQPLQLRWLESVVTGCPADICQMHIPDILPAIIRNQVAVAGERIFLDNGEDAAIKHKINTKSVANAAGEGGAA